MNNKAILMFCDLEGTLLNEKNGTLDARKLFRFFDQINKIQQTTKSTVYLHLLSPIPLNIMSEVLDKLDTYIAKYNREKRTFIRDIQGATASYPAGISQEENTYDRIAPFPERATKDAYDIAAQGKLEYVEKWIRGINNLDFCIYAGNGRNDFRAIDYIRKNSRGYSICPDNSRKTVKKVATFTSESTDIEGIIDGLDRLNQYLIQKNRNEDTRDER
ncbi:MAG: hypothetical protein U0M00_00090 [Clostridia bacterium]|nr:hypothetical protein [Clostridia bacterium]